MLDEELTNNLAQFMFRKTASGIGAGLKKSLKIFSWSKHKISDKINDKIHSGKQSIKSLNANFDNWTVISVTEEELKKFDKYAKHYKLDYSILQNKSDKSIYSICVPVGEVDRFEAAVRDFVSDKTLNNNELGERIEKAKETFDKYTAKRTQEKTKVKTKQKQRNISK